MARIETPEAGAGSAASDEGGAGRNLIESLAGEVGLKLVTPGDLTIRRRRVGKGFAYLRPRGGSVRDKATLDRLRSLAVPPAYTNVYFAADPRAHIQAVGTDTAGRLQYRYHPDWTLVREALKERRLAHLIEALPEMRRTVARDLETRAPTRRRALAAAIRLVEKTAIRAGNDCYARESGSRGAATLEKDHVRIVGDEVHLAFRAKGGKQVERTVTAPRLARTLKAFLRLPGRRLFQFRDRDGTVRPITTADMNAYIKEAAQRPISVKDVRTLAASAAAVEALADETPEETERRRKSQINKAVRQVAEHLANTPAVARKSYIHASVIDAFEEGRLKRLKSRIRVRPFAPRRERLLLAVIRDAMVRRRRAAKAQNDRGTRTPTQR